MQSVKGYAALPSGFPASIALNLNGAMPTSATSCWMYSLLRHLHHTDVLTKRKNEWGGSMLPMVPGHEIVGRVMPHRGQG